MNSEGFTAIGRIRTRSLERRYNRDMMGAVIAHWEQDSADLGLALGKKSFKEVAMFTEGTLKLLGTVLHTMHANVAPVRLPAYSRRRTSEYLRDEELLREGTRILGEEKYANMVRTIEWYAALVQRAEELQGVMNSSRGLYDTPTRSRITDWGTYF